MTQYKIQVGSWTKLPNGQVQEDTRDIMEMMGKICNVNLETHIATTGDDWVHLGVLDAFHSDFSIHNGEPHVALYDITGDGYHIGHEQHLFIPYEELQKMLNTPVETPKEQEMPKVSFLLNTKLDCRKPDGSVDEELSRAFQEACFEQGILWPISKGNVSHLNAEFLYADTDQYLSMGGNEEYFNKVRENKQINFKYSRTLTWEATVVEPVIPEPVDEMVDICGVEYSAKELSEALALIKSARKG